MTNHLLSTQSPQYLCVHVVDVWICYFLSFVHREVQYIVLQNIATMSIQRKVSLLVSSRTIMVYWFIDTGCLITRFISKQGMFEPFMKSFYVRSTDATHIKTLKVAASLFCALYCTSLWAQMRANTILSLWTGVQSVVIILFKHVKICRRHWRLWVCKKRLAVIEMRLLIDKDNCYNEHLSTDSTCIHTFKLKVRIFGSCFSLWK